MNRRHRLVASLLAVLALVFSQLAVSAHACVLAGQPLLAAAASAHDCCAEDGSADGNPAGDNVCVEHCHYGEASFDGGQSVPAMVGQVGSILRVDSPARAFAASIRPAWLLTTPATPPPVAILFGVLRI